MEMASSDSELRAALFRFVDVVPACRSLDCVSVFASSVTLASTVLASATFPPSLLAATAKTGRDPFRGLKVGMASYTLRKFTLDQAIAMIERKWPAT